MDKYYSNKKLKQTKKTPKKQHSIPLRTVSDEPFSVNVKNGTRIKIPDSFFLKPLCTVLEEFGVPADVYCIGEYCEGSLCLENMNDTWQIYVGERSQKYALQEYASLKTACHEFIKLILDEKDYESAIQRYDTLFKDISRTYMNELFNVAHNYDILERINVCSPCFHEREEVKIVENSGYVPSHLSNPIFHRETATKKKKISQSSFNSLRRH